HMTGWKIGYCVAPANLTAEFRKVHQFVTFSTSTPMQYGIADMLREYPDYGRDLAGFYEVKRNVFANAVAESDFRLLPCHGTYFQLLDYSAISDMNDLQFTEWLTKEKGIATIPISPFCEKPFAGKYIRCCFAKSEATLEEVGQSLCKVSM
ncbi:MAG: aminotransferase class I/II-fold pyridoxal phosphate-dependent enzyme, partial [Enterobacterales bacterium]|nr:aminotransferase class I/II-fold pyridoxal phosphate-dependent enzyme [Enterobacterales bacterium]